MNKKIWTDIKGRFFAVLLIASLVGLDQLSKHFVKIYLKDNKSKTIIKDILHFTYSENRGAAFGILENHRWIFISVTAVVIIFLLFLVYKKKIVNLLPLTAVCLVIAGGLGNLYDRLYMGYVVDFIEFKFINFAIFNLADTFVVVGGIAFGVMFAFFEGTVWKK